MLVAPQKKTTLPTSPLEILFPAGGLLALLTNILALLKFFYDRQIENGHTSFLREIQELQRRVTLVQ